MDEREEKKDEEETKKDSLMWSEEDYDAMQKLTGFDEESIVEDQKKGINLIIFIVVCIVCLIVGILIGYSINKKDPEEKPSITVIETLEDEKAKMVAVYNRLNVSSELYLYTLNSNSEEISILDLTDSKYAYQYLNEELFVLIEKDGLNLYNYSFTKDGYHRELVKKFDEEYSTFYFKNALILIMNKNNIKIYNTEGTLVNELSIAADRIYDYTSDYIIYTEDSKLNIYYIKNNTSKILAKKSASFLYLDNDQIFYIEKNKLYKYSITDDIQKEITSIEENSIFVKVDDYYMFNDGKTLYIYEKDVKKIKEFDLKINEIANLDHNNLLFILEDYNTADCLMKDKKFYTYSILNKALSEKNISGCLDTQVINGVINVQ